MQEEQVPKHREEPTSEEEVNVIGLLKDADQFRRTFDCLEKVAHQRIKAQQFEAAIDCLNKCNDMLQVPRHSGSNCASQLGANLLPNLCFAKPAVYLTLAAAYQGSWKIQKCSKFCHLAEIQLAKLLGDPTEAPPEASQPAATQSRPPEQYLKFCRHLVTLKFQHCAILSQLNNHDKALETCRAALPLLQKAVEVLKEQLGGSSEAGSSRKDQGVAFRGRVSELAKRILGHLTNQLSQNIEMGQSRSSHLYFWERNPEKNEEQLRRIFVKQGANNEAKRSILGVNKQNQWIDDFNIGSIMRMPPILTVSLQKSMPIQEYFFKDRLFQLSIHCSLAYFTIATQMRFMDSQHSGLEVQASSSSSETLSQHEQRLQSIKRKYGYEQKSAVFKLSEAYHLRAIDIVSSNINAPIPYLNHMIKSYDKHYVFKKQLEEIAALGDESCIQPSMMNQQSALKQKSSIIQPPIEDDRPYGDEIRREQTQGSGSEYGDYLESKERKLKESRPTVVRKIEESYKQPRNTVKPANQFNQSDPKSRAKSAGKLRKTHKAAPAPKEQTINVSKKRIKEEKARDTGMMKKKSRVQLKEYEGEGEMQVRTKSSTSIRLVFKRKK